MPEFEITIKFKYTPEPENYPAFTDIHDCLDMDIENIQNNPGEYLSGDIEVTGKVIKDND